MTNKPMLSVERDKFESLYRAEVERQGKNFEPVIFRLDDNGDYFIGLVQAAWWGYQQSEPTAQHQGEPVAWSYCPECGCEELHHEEGEHKQCANCHQEWFSDINYSEVVRGNLQKLKSEQLAPVAVVLPERKTKADYSGYIEQFQSEAAGLYNSALDDVARLNGVKP